MEEFKEENIVEADEVVMSPEEEQELNELDEARFTGKGWDPSKLGRLDELHEKRKKARGEDKFN